MDSNSGLPGLKPMHEITLLPLLNVISLKQTKNVHFQGLGVRWGNRSCYSFTLRYSSVIYKILKAGDLNWNSNPYVKFYKSFFYTSVYQVTLKSNSITYFEFKHLFKLLFVCIYVHVSLYLNLPSSKLKTVLNFLTTS